jgi:hypothetical protein
MKHIRIIKTGINVKKILKQLEEHASDWNYQKELQHAVVLDPKVYLSQSGVLQLVIGTIDKPGDYVFNSEGCQPAPAYYRHTEAISFMKRHFKDFKRAGFLSIPVGGEVGKHRDFGTYYLDKDRYHLSIQGRYEYTVGDETAIIEPGTLFWFQNKLEHSAKNIGDIVRISLVFDVPHSKNNP